MDRGDLADRLPNLPLDRVPGLGGESDPEPPDTFDEPIETADTFDEPTEASDDERIEPADEELIDDSSDGTDAEPEEEATPSRREQVRKALLGVSIGGAALAVLAAIVRRLLGGDESDDDGAAVEGAEQDIDAEPADEQGIDVGPADEQDGPAPDAEAVAATIGLAFQVLVRRLVGEDESQA
ncbi:hypothetical protein [Halapricum desulfuricans]|uniref:Uncharacterized protein n=1 Tax=Halapricum desulfuricans TaxID=2841257 RepID=A0A897N373_9EURY|nr:hypothetical protein [Halapricum desulfuricans]QSG05185.1 hypothetical protein HSR121_0833 [Halapricum desulfuricans]